MSNMSFKIIKLKNTLNGNWTHIVALKKQSPEPLDDKSRKVAIICNEQV